MYSKTQQYLISCIALVFGSFILIETIPYLVNGYSFCEVGKYLGIFSIELFGFPVLFIFLLFLAILKLSKGSGNKYLMLYLIFSILVFYFVLYLVLKNEYQ
jgi:hypothetical protein